jgi:hypothetical protein
MLRDGFFIELLFFHQSPSKIPLLVASKDLHANHLPLGATMQGNLQVLFIKNEVGNMYYSSMPGI